MVNKFDKIPDELKLKAQWILWKKEQNPKNPAGKPTKVPYQTNGYRASSTNPKHWATYLQAKKKLDESNGKYSGLGFVFTAEDPFVGIDLDNVIDADGQLDPKAKDVIDTLDSYTEFSQSKTGAHIIIKAELPFEKGRKSQDKMIELYEKERYFVMTGDALEGRTTIENRQNEINIIAEKYFPAKKEPKKSEKTQKRESLSLSDQDIIDKISKSKVGSKFQAVFSGDLSLYGGDHSAADQALCNYLVSYTDDFQQVDSIFKASGLYRDKWDRQDYKNSTIEKAFRDRSWRYDPNYHKKNNSAAADFNLDLEDKELKDKYFIVLRNKTKPEAGFKIDVSLLTKYIKEKYDIKVYKEQFKVRKKHYYQNVEKIKHIINAEIPVELRLPQVVKDCEELLLMDGDLMIRDRNLAPPKYLSFENGVLNVDTMNFFQPSDPIVSKLIFINSVGYNYNPKAIADPFIDKYFDSVTKGNQEDINYLYQVLGVAMSSYRSFKNIFYFSGVKDSGKSVYMKIAEKLLTAPDGTRDFSNIGLKTLTDETSKEFTSIIGKRANICGESPDIKISNDTLLKQLSGGDSIAAHVKFREPIEFVNKAMLIFSGNTVPNFFVSDKSSISERMLIYKFKTAIPKDQQEKDLADKINMEYVIIKALEQLRIFIKNNQEFCVPAEIADNREEMLKDSDVIYQFYKECLEVTKTSKDRISTSDLYDYFIRYLVKEGRIRLDGLGDPDVRNLKVTQHTLTSKIKILHGEAKYKRNIAYNNSKSDCFIGLSLLDSYSDLALITVDNRADNYQNLSFIR